MEPSAVRPVDVTLARAKCPRCGIVIVAASPIERDKLARAHDEEVHGLVSPAAPSAATNPAIAGAVHPC